uniref:Uncharacterized protein n=1 Tax=Knipowitschia caucasica TaxID=637954 RepID=A0AAV2LR12_KNICA
MNKDDVYAYALSKTLTRVRAPATVGLYSTCEDRINLVLEQMEVHLRSESRRGQQRSLCSCASLIWKLLFFKPIWTQQNLNHHHVRFIHVQFSAWHFAGSDLLWAGLALRLFYAMKVNFGKLQLVLHRVAQYQEEDEVKKKKIEDSAYNWRSKKCCCIPLWLCFVLILLVPLIVLIFFLIFGLPDPDPSAVPNNGTKSHLHVFEGLVIASFGVPAASAVRFLLSTGKNLIFSQDYNIRRGMDSENVSSKLGFMNEVRKEIWVMTRFVQFMEVFERRRIRIVLQITNLDRCSPMKIALHTEIPSMENIAAWVVLANHWPCRLSWIMQCVEDEKQRAEIEGRRPRTV